MYMLEMLYPVLCGFLNRVRGGLFGDQIRTVFPYWSTTVSRLMMGLVYGLPLVYLYGGQWFMYPLIPIIIYLGHIFRTGPWQYMENLPKDIFSLGMRGLVVTLPAGLMCANYLFAVSGALMGVVYFTGKYLIEDMLDYTESEGYRWIGSDYGEVLFAVVLGSAIVLNGAIL